MIEPCVLRVPLACIASEEILYPEIARALALRGAEVFCHSSSEIGSPLATHKDVAKQARAFEIMNGGWRSHVLRRMVAALEALPD